MSYLSHRWAAEYPPFRAALNTELHGSSTRYIGVLGLLGYWGLQMADPCEPDGSYEATRVPDVDTPALNHLF